MTMFPVFAAALDPVNLNPHKALGEEYLLQKPKEKSSLN